MNDKDLLCIYYTYSIPNMYTMEYYPPLKEPWDQYVKENKADGERKIP